MTKNRTWGSTIATGALVLASLGVFSGVANAVPTPPNPAPPANYGGCVSDPAQGVDPSAGTQGPLNPQSEQRRPVTGAVNGKIRSGGNSRFESGVGCGT